MEQQKKVRLFVAVTLPEQVCNEIQRVQTILKKSSLCDGRYVNATHAHLTLVFIGEIDEQEITALDMALQTISFPAIKATTSTLNLFEKHGKIRIIYFEIIAPLLKTVAQLISETLRPWVATEARPFVSHATIMRVKKVHDTEKLLALLQTINIAPLEFTIDSFALMESELHPDGPQYTERKRYMLLGKNY